VQVPGKSAAKSFRSIGLKKSKHQRDLPLQRSGVAAPRKCGNFPNSGGTTDFLFALSRKAQGGFLFGGEMERFVFETTQGAVLEAAEEAALMDYARVRANAVRPCVLVAVLTLGFSGWFLFRQDWTTALYTVLLGLLLSAFFWLPMLGGKRFRTNVRNARAQRGNLTNTVRAKPIRFVFEGDGCRMLDGKGEEVRFWEDFRMGEVRESDRLFWLPVEDTSILLPKSALKEGTEDKFRGWLKSHSRHYRVCKVTDRLRRSLERE